MVGNGNALLGYLASIRWNFSNSGIRMSSHFSCSQSAKSVGPSSMRIFRWRGRLHYLPYLRCPAPGSCAGECAGKSSASGQAGDEKWSLNFFIRNLRVPPAVSTMRRRLQSIRRISREHRCVRQDSGRHLVRMTAADAERLAERLISKIFRRSAYGSLDKGRFIKFYNERRYSGKPAEVLVRSKAPTPWANRFIHF